MNPARRAIGLAALLQRAEPRLHEHTRCCSVGTGRVVTERGTVTARMVIVAVDGRLDVLLPQLAGRVRTARLQMLRDRAGRARAGCPARSTAGGATTTPSRMPDGRLFVGGGRDRFVDAGVDDRGRADARRCRPTSSTSRPGSPAAPVEVTHRWAASVGFTDGTGARCAPRSTTGVVAIGGYSGTGNLVGPVAARAAVALALDGTAAAAVLRGLSADHPSTVADRIPASPLGWIEDAVVGRPAVVHRGVAARRVRREWRVRGQQHGRRFGRGDPVASQPAGGATSRRCARRPRPRSARRPRCTRTRRGTLTVATDSPAYEPWFVDDKPTNGKGFESAVAYAVAKQLGYSTSQVKWTVRHVQQRHRADAEELRLRHQRGLDHRQAGQGRRLLQRLLRRGPGHRRAEEQQVRQGHHASPA